MSGGASRAILAVLLVVLPSLALAGCLGPAVGDLREFVRPLFRDASRGEDVRVSFLDPLGPTTPEGEVDVLRGSVPGLAGAAGSSGATRLSRSEWEWLGREHSVEVAVPEDLYTLYSSRSRSFDVGTYAQYVTDPADDRFLAPFAERLREAAVKAGYDELGIPEFLLAYSQSLPYDSDLNTTGREDFPRYPVETLVDGGDCEDHAILYAALLDALGYRTVLLLYPGHLAVGLENLGYGEEPVATWREVDYIYTEPTARGWRVAQRPEIALAFEPVVLPVTDAPVLEYTLSVARKGGSFEATVTFYNNGTAPSEGVRLWLGLDAVQGGVWTQAMHTGITVPEDGVLVRRFTLPDAAPDGVQVRVRGILQGDGVSNSERVGPWMSS